MHNNPPISISPQILPTQREAEENTETAPQASLLARIIHKILHALDIFLTPPIQLLGTFIPLTLINVGGGFQTSLYLSNIKSPQDLTSHQKNLVLIISSILALVSATVTTKFSWDMVRPPILLDQASELRKYFHYIYHHSSTGMIFMWYMILTGIIVLSLLNAAIETTPSSLAQSRSWNLMRQTFENETLFQSSSLHEAAEVLEYTTILTNFGINTLAAGIMLSLVVIHLLRYSFMDSDDRKHQLKIARQRNHLRYCQEQTLILSSEHLLTMANSTLRLFQKHYPRNFPPTRPAPQDILGSPLPITLQLDELHRSRGVAEPPHSERHTAYQTLRLPTTSPAIQPLSSSFLRLFRHAFRRILTFYPHFKELGAAVAATVVWQNYKNTNIAVLSTTQTSRLAPLHPFLFYLGCQELNIASLWNFSRIFMEYRFCKEGTERFLELYMGMRQETQRLSLFNRKTAHFLLSSSISLTMLIPFFMYAGTITNPIWYEIASTFLLGFLSSIPPASDTSASLLREGTWHSCCRRTQHPHTRSKRKLQEALLTFFDHWIAGLTRAESDRQPNHEETLIQTFKKLQQDPALNDLKKAAEAHQHSLSLPPPIRGRRDSDASISTIVLQADPNSETPSQRHPSRRERPEDNLLSPDL